MFENNLHDNQEEKIWSKRFYFHFYLTSIQFFPAQACPLKSVHFCKIENNVPFVRGEEEVLGYCKWANSASNSTHQELTHTEFSQEVYAAWWECLLFSKPSISLDFSVGSSPHLNLASIPTIPPDTITFPPQSPACHLLFVSIRNCRHDFNELFEKLVEELN